MKKVDWVKESMVRVFCSPLTYIGLVLVAVCVATLGRYGLWGDEAFSAAASIQSIGRIIEISAGDTNPPLYHLSLKYWGMLWNHNVIWIRMYSVLWYVIALVAVYHIAHRVFESRLWSSLSVLAFGLNPVVIFFAQEVRYYAMNYALLALLGWLSLIIYETPIAQISRWIWAAWSVVIIAGLYTHSTFVFIFPIAGLLLLGRFALLWWDENKGSATKDYLGFLKQIIPLIISGLAVVVAYIPWLPVILQSNSEISQSFWITFDPLGSIPDQLSNLYTGAVYPELNAFWLVVRITLEYVGVGGMAIGTILGFRHPKARILSIFVASFCVISYLFSFFTPVFYSRYLSVLLPFAGVLIVYSIRQLIPRISRNVAIGVVVVYASLSGLWYYGFIITNPVFKPSYNEVAAFIISEIDEGSTIIYPNMSNYSGSLYYLRNYDYQQRFWDPKRQEPKWAGISMVAEERYIPTDEVLEMSVVYVSYEGNGNDIENVLRDNNYENTQTHILGGQGFYVWER